MEVERLIATYSEYANVRRTYLARLGCKESNRDPLAEFSERLIAELVNGRVAANRVQKDYDVETDIGALIQVKYLANPRSADINGHEIRFPSLATHYAIVYFEDLDLHSVLMFNRGCIGPVYDTLKKRHKGRGEVLLVQRANILSIVSRPYEFRDLGVEVLYTTFLGGAE